MRAPARRADNLVSGLLSHAHRLSVHVKVCLEAVSAYRKLVSRLRLGFSAIVLFTTGVGWLTRNWWFNSEWKVALNERNWDGLSEPGIAIGVLIVLAALFWWFLSLGLRNLRRSIETEEGVDVFFKRAFKDELSVKKRADLYSTWESIKPGILEIMRIHGLRSLSASASSKKILRNLEAAIEIEIPALRHRIDFENQSASEEEKTVKQEENTDAHLSTDPKDS